MNRLALVYARSNLGMDALLIRVEVHLSDGMPHLSIVGLPETAVKESRERVRSAIINSGFTFPVKRITINLAPANLPKRDGGRFDLAIAVGILVASGQMRIKDLEKYEFSGELALDGTLQEGRGILSVALATQKAQRVLILPFLGSQEAAIIPNLNALTGNSLREICQYFAGELNLSKIIPVPLIIKEYAEDLSEVNGQPLAKRALEIAAAGGHNLLFWGAPGVGKSLLAKRLPTILPPLELPEILEVAKIYSIAGNFYTYTVNPPFRAPHHSASLNALVGGGNPPKPGEISLANHGILFLDELLEFPRAVLEALREPLENQQITIARADSHINFPANFQLVAAMNPCPCGYWGDKLHTCICSTEQIRRYQNRLSGPFLERIDLWVKLQSIPEDRLRIFLKGEEESSSEVKKRILNVRKISKSRGEKVNAHLTKEELLDISPLDSSTIKEFEILTKKLELSARSYLRLLRVARTIADLSMSREITLEHLGEALSYRQSFLNG